MRGLIMRGGAAHNRDKTDSKRGIVMLKHLQLYRWICAALALGILVCLVILALLLLKQPGACVYPGARFVKEARHLARV